MAKTKLHTEALMLRKRGMSYSQIKNELRVSKSTLSRWLKDFPLDKEQLNKLNYKNEVRIERYRNTMKKKREERKKKVFDKEKDELLPLTNKELYLFGLGLYWGDGLKANDSMVSFTNSNPEMMYFCVKWLVDIMGIEKSKLKARLHLYEDMDVEKETRYWSKKIDLTEECFGKPYIKKTTIRSVVYKGYGHGTCDVGVGGVDSKLKIMMGIEVISNYFLEKMI